MGDGRRKFTKISRAAVGMGIPMGMGLVWG